MSSLSIESSADGSQLAHWPRPQGTCRPQQPTAFMTEALWTTRYSIPALTALSTRSLWVVALQHNNNLPLNMTARGCGLSAWKRAALTRRGRPPPGRPRLRRQHPSGSHWLPVLLGPGPPGSPPFHRAPPGVSISTVTISTTLKLTIEILLGIAMTTVSIDTLLNWLACG